MNTVIVSQMGARMHYAVPRAFHDAGRLERFYTDICATQGWPSWLAAIPDQWQPSLVRRLLGRVPKGLPQDRLTTFPLFGLAAVLRRTRARSVAHEAKLALRDGKTFSRLVNRYGFGKANGFFGYNGECLEQLLAARQAGLWTAVEQTIAPREIVNRLFEDEQAAFPDWHLQIHSDSASADYIRREKAEWDAADVILCGSEFVRGGIANVGGPVERSVVVPYGVDARFSLPPRKERNGPLRVITVGEVGLRKGSPYVVEAARKMKGRALFRMVGPCNAPPETVAEISQYVELRGIVPRSDITAEYEWADVFLLPSICEGSATAAYEALAASLPVICTPNTGSVVRDGQEGFIVPIRDPEAIAASLERLIDEPELRLTMALNAGKRALEFTVDNYAARLLASLPGSIRDNGDRRCAA